MRARRRGEFLNKNENVRVRNGGNGTDFFSFLCIIVLFLSSATRAGFSPSGASLSRSTRSGSTTSSPRALQVATIHTHTRTPPPAVRRSVSPCWLKLQTSSQVHHIVKGLALVLFLPFLPRSAGVESMTRHHPSSMYFSRESETNI